MRKWYAVSPDVYFINYIWGSLSWWWWWSMMWCKLYFLHALHEYYFVLPCCTNWCSTSGHREFCIVRTIFSLENIDLHSVNTRWPYRILWRQDVAYLTLPASFFSSSFILSSILLLAFTVFYCLLIYLKNMNSLGPVSGQILCWGGFSRVFSWTVSLWAWWLWWGLDTSQRNWSVFYQHQHKQLGQFSFMEAAKSPKCGICFSMYIWSCELLRQQCIGHRISTIVVWLNGQ